MARLDLATRWAVRASIANRIVLARRAFRPPSSSSREKNADPSVLMGRRRYVRGDPAIQIGHRMIWIPKGEDPLAREPHQVIRVREHRGDRALVCGLHACRDGVR